MFRATYGSILTIIVLIMLCTCIDPYTPELPGYESLLVVDGLLTNDRNSCSVRLTRTITDQNSIPENVSDAVLFITDEKEIRTDLRWTEGGTYKTDSTLFHGETGKTYTLHIIADDKEYRSEPCLMEGVPEIDKVYFERHEELTGNGTENAEGIMIYLDSRDGSNNYYRWDFTETWKFRVPYPKKFDYVNDSTFIPVAVIREFCWKNRKSDDILVQTLVSGRQERVYRQPLFFIQPDKSDRLLLQYSILARQFSISKKEYDFWSGLKKVNESGGDIFSTQPFSVVSNIRNINDPGEMVLGYFKVSAVSEKRLDIVFNELINSGFTFYEYPCVSIPYSAEDRPSSGMGPPLKWDEIYEMFCVTSDYYFIEPLYVGNSKVLRKLVFTMPECADCGLTGESEKPDFWIDRN